MKSAEPRTTLGELVATLDEDPWGLPYRLVLKRLRRSSPGLTVTLEPAVLERLLSELFPPGRELQPVPMPEVQWTDDLGFSSADVARTLEEKRNPNTAPGPDGFKAEDSCSHAALSRGMLHHLFEAWNLSYGVKSRGSCSDPEGRVNSWRASQS